MLNKHAQRLWDTPVYADFPRSEYDNRIVRVKKYMEKQKIDLLALWGDINIRYFSGFQSLHWSAMTIQSAVLLIPVDKDPVIVVPDFFVGVVEGYTYLKEIRLLSDPHVTKVIRALPVDISNLIKELGYGKGTIALESGFQGGMYIPRPINDIDLFRSELPDATFVDGCDLIWKCRVIKSANEVEALKKATRAIVQAYGEVVATYTPGMNEKDMGWMIRNAILKHTEDCAPPIATCSSRRIVMPDTPSFYEEVPVAMGDRLVFEPLPTYKGYHGSCCRIFQIGPIKDEVLKKAEAVDKAQEAAIAAIKPGIKSGILMEVIADTLRSEGIEPTIEMAGHGVGLNAQEPPMIAVNEEQLIEEGMVLAVEVWVVDWSGLSMAGTATGLQSFMPELFGNEDLVVVTKDGCDRFPSFRKDIRHLPYNGPVID